MDLSKYQSKLAIDRKVADRKKSRLKIKMGSGGLNHYPTGAGDGEPE